MVSHVLRATGLVVTVLSICLLAGCGSNNKNKSTKAKNVEEKKVQVRTRTRTVKAQPVLFAKASSADVVPHVSKPLYEREKRGYSASMSRYRMKAEMEQNRARDEAMIENTGVGSTAAETRTATRVVSVKFNTADLPEMDDSLDPRFLETERYNPPKAEILTSVEDEPYEVIEGPEIGWVTTTSYRP